MAVKRGGCHDLKHLLPIRSRSLLTAVNKRSDPRPVQDLSTTVNKPSQSVVHIVSQSNSNASSKVAFEFYWSVARTSSLYQLIKFAGVILLAHEIY